MPDAVKFVIFCAAAILFLPSIVYYFKHKKYKIYITPIDLSTVSKDKLELARRVIKKGLSDFDSKCRLLSLPNIIYINKDGYGTSYVDFEHYSAVGYDKLTFSQAKELALIIVQIVKDRLPFIEWELTVEEGKIYFKYTIPKEKQELKKFS